MSTITVTYEWTAEGRVTFEAPADSTVAQLNELAERAAIEEIGPHNLSYVEIVDSDPPIIG